jgi:5-methyltetrahydrofolate--homocysteine methyltransferase
LITPSLDEMVHVAKEMEKAGFTIPLLIGGATTSKIHTAVKIDENYKGGQTIYVLDASRSVPVVEKLLGEGKSDFVAEVKKEYAELRENHKNRKSSVEYVSIDVARQNKPFISFSSREVAQPNFTGIKVFESYPLEELRSYIDWSPFFNTWEMKGTFPRIFESEKYGTEAKKLFNDANQLLDKIIAEKWLTAKGVLGIFPANSDEDDILIKGDAAVKKVHHLRQQSKKQSGSYNKCLSDFLAPNSSGVDDYMGAFAVTAGIGMEKWVQYFEEKHDDYNSIMLKALADRLAEAFAERLHERVRKEFWGYAPDENLSNEDLVREKYRGIRPAPGYAACPDHTEKELLFKLLDAENNTGITLTESYAMYPTASVSGWYFAHPEAEYLGVGKIGKDQLEDYAARKGYDIATMEKWMAVNLNYEV